MKIFVELISLQAFRFHFFFFPLYIVLKCFNVKSFNLFFCGTSLRGLWRVWQIEGY